MAAGFNVSCGGGACDEVSFHDDGTVSIGFAKLDDTALLLPHGSGQKSAAVSPVASEAMYENWWGCKEGRSAQHGL